MLKNLIVEDGIVKTRVASSKVSAFEKG